MVDYKCRKCGRLLFKADIECGSIETKCPDCGAFLEVVGDYCKVEGERTWREFKADCEFEDLVAEYNADLGRVQYAEEYAPRVYALYRRLHPNARIRFEVEESDIRTYFAVYLKVDDLDNSGYFPCHRELIGLFDNACKDDYSRLL